MSDTDYNELLLQISTNLNNTLNTWGASSHQYQAVLQTLKDLLQRIEQRDAQPVKSAPVDSDMLSQAMEFLKLG
ncbi:hypothetical protein DPV78_005707 [Talaromyces pinophilus]|nr:hypothetical protein DPV78_005707 [Talaromyces pinophilus]